MGKNWLDSQLLVFLLAAAAKGASDIEKDSKNHKKLKVTYPPKIARDED